MSQQWHVGKDDKQYGPFSSVQLKKLADTNQISPDDLVWKKGLTEWVAASSIKGLFSPLAPPLPPKQEICPSNPNESRQEVVHANTLQSAVNQKASVPKPGWHKQRLFLLIAACLGAGATFLPWAHMPIVGSIPGSIGDGWLTFILFLVVVFFSMRGVSHTAVQGGKRLCCVISAFLATSIGVQKIVGFHDRISRSPRDNPFATALSEASYIGVGLYLVVGAGLCITLFAWMSGEKGEPVEVKNVNSGLSRAQGARG